MPSYEQIVRLEGVLGDSVVFGALAALARRGKNAPSKPLLDVLCAITEQAAIAQGMVRNKASSRDIARAEAMLHEVFADLWTATRDNQDEAAA